MIETIVVLVIWVGIFIEICKLLDKIVPRANNTLSVDDVFNFFDEIKEGQKDDV